MATPGQILDIGTADGQSHFNVGIGRPGAHTDYTCQQIQDGYTSDPEFMSNAGGTAVQFRVRMDAARTSANTKYPRSELREYNEAGTGNASWNGASGTHYMQGISKITHLQPVKPWVVFCQIHDASSDLVRVQTEGTSTSALKIVMRNTAPGSSSETVKTVMASYTLGTEITWKLEVINGSGTLYLNGASVGTFPASTSGCYFKAGAYAQSNSDTDAAAEYSAVELRALSTWHTGYPTANPIPGGGGAPPPGTATITPGTVLDIGAAAGKNHFKYLGARTGNSAFFERTQTQIDTDGYSEDPYFVLNAAKTAVGLRVNADAPVQSGTTFPRAELREMGTDGTTVYAFNALSGVHYIRGRTRITHLGTSQSGKGVRIVELNNGSTNVLAIETQFVTSNVRLRCLINGVAQSPELVDVAGDTDGSQSIVGAEFSWMIRCENGQLSVYFMDMAVPALTVALSGTGSAWFFRTGIFPQFNSTTDSGGYASGELRALEHWHTGWPPSNGNGQYSSAAPPQFGAVGTYVEHAVGGPITPPFPAGTSPGHVCLTQVYWRTATGAAPAGTSGWELLSWVADPGGGRQAVYGKVYAAGDVAPAYSGGTDGIYGRMQRFTDVDQVTPWDAARTTSSGSSTTAPSAPSIVVADPSAVIWFIAQRNDYTHATPTNGATLAYTNTTVTGGDACLTSAYKTLGSPSTSGAMAVTASGQTTLPEYSGIAVALSPVEPHVIFPVPAIESVVETLDVQMFRSTPVPIIDLVVEATGDKKTVDALDSMVEPLPVLFYAEPRTTPVLRETVSGVLLYADTNDTLTLDTSGGVLVDDLLVAIYGVDFGDANQSGGPGFGWQEVATSSYSSSSPHIKVWTKRVTANGKQTVSVTHTDQFADAELVVLVLAGTNEHQIISNWAASSGAHATSHVAPSVSTVDKDELLVSAWMSGPNAGDMGNYAAPAAMTERAEVDATNYSTLMVATQVLNAAGVTGTKTATFTRSTSPTTVTGYAALTLGFRGITPASSAAQPSPLGMTSDVQVSKSVTVYSTSTISLGSGGSAAKCITVHSDSPMVASSLVAGARDVISLPAGGPIDLSLWVLDGAGNYLGALPDAISIALSPVINEPGGASISYPRDGHNFALLRDMVDDDRDLELAVWVGGREDGSLRVLITEVTGDEVDPHAIWTFSGTFLEARLGEAVIYPNPDTLVEPTPPVTPPPPPAPGTPVVPTLQKGQWLYTNVTAGSLMRTLMAQAKARGTLTDLYVDSFSDAVGSNGVRFSRTMTVTLSPGQSYLQVLGTLVDLALCEWEVIAEGGVRKLKLYEPDTRGRDRSAQYPPITLRAGKDLTDSPRKYSVKDAPTTLLAAGKDGIFQAVDDPTAQARRGRRIESYVNQANIADQGALLAYAQTNLASQVEGAMELSQGLTFGPGGPLPLADFDRFDWVLADNGHGLERLRVAQWTISQDAHGQQTGGAVLNDFVADFNAKLARRLAALEAGTTVVGTPEPTPTPTNDAKAPAAPLGLVATSLVYQQLSPPASAATINAGWAAVNTSADGTALTAGGIFYRVRYRYTDGSNPASPLPWPEGWVSDKSDGYTWMPAGTSNTTQIQFSGLEPDKAVSIEVAAVLPVDAEKQPYEHDDKGRAFRRTELQSAWSAPFQLVTAQDVTAPPPTSIPVASEYLGTIRISWDGLSAQGLPMAEAAPDFSHVEVHLSPVRNFTPDGPAGDDDPDTAPTYKDRLFGAGATVVTDLLYQVSYYAKLVPVDLAGNKGTASEQGVAVPQPVVTDDVFDGAIGSAKLADLAVVRAKIADLAVNSAKIADLSVGKLTAGTMTADILLAGRIKTAEAGARIELDATSFRQYNALNQLRTQFVGATGDALVTGTIRTALAGKRVELSPDGTLKLFPDSGQNFNAMFNNGNEVVFRGQLDGSGRSGYLRLNSGGIAQQFGVPGASVTSQLSVKTANIDATTPVIGLRVDQRYATADGLPRRVVLLNNDNAGADIGLSVLSYEFPYAEGPLLYARGSNLRLFFAGDAQAGVSGGKDHFELLYGDSAFADMHCGNITAPNVTAPSGARVKKNIRDVELSPLDVVRKARSKQWQYDPTAMRKGGGTPREAEQIGPLKMRRRKPGTDPLTGNADDFELIDAPGVIAQPVAPPSPDRIGPIADDILAVAPELVTRAPNGDLTLSYMDMVGLLWSAMEELSDRLDAITDKFPDIDPLPGGAAKGQNAGRGRNKIRPPKQPKQP